MRALQLLFLFSGATSLIWESLWSRQLHLLFGTSQFAIATVLCAFMAGLAGGAAIAARYGDQQQQPLRSYAILEGLVGIFGLIFPFLLSGMEPLYLGLAGGLPPVAFGIIQFLMVGSLLLIPTACMGATLPVLTPLVQRRGAGAIGRLYAVNTVGAVAGVFFAGFYLLPDLGVHLTTVLNSTANLCLAAVAWRLAQQPRVEAEGEEARPLEEKPPAGLGLLAAVAALAGFSSLALEVSWFRLLALILGASAYAFSLMLLAFLFGIASGGEVGGWLAGRLQGAKVRLGAAWAQAGVGILSWISAWLYGWLPLLFVKIYFEVRRVEDLIWPAKCLVAIAVMTPPAFLMGLGFPLLIRAAGIDPRSSAVGRIYAANTAGGVLGSFMAGFVLLPTIGLRSTVLVAVSVYLVAGALLVGRRVQSAILALAAILIWTAPPPWDPSVMTTGVYKYVDDLDEATWEEMRLRMIDRYRLLYYNEGLSSVVTVAINRITGNIWLANNGKIDASTTADMPTQVLVAHLPFLFLGDRAEHGMLIGLASGITLGALNLHSELDKIDVVEIEPRMPEAAQIFAPWNHDALSDPRIQLFGNDGRNQILLTPEHSLDVVVSEPSNPWLTGVSNLFTHEFFTLGKSRLKPGGIWSQWVQMYGMDERDLRAVIRTFSDVFPYVRIFATIEDADLVMVGSDQPLHLDREVAATFLHKNVGLESELAQIGLATPEDVLSVFLMDRDQVFLMAQAGEEPWREEAPLNTDDNLLVEYSAPKNLHRHTSAKNMQILRYFGQIPEGAYDTADGWISLAQTFYAREDLVRAMKCLRAADALEPGREDIKDWKQAYLLEIRRRLAKP